MEKEKAKCLLIFQMQCVGLAQRVLTPAELAAVERVFDLAWGGGVIAGKEAVLGALAPRLEKIVDKTLAAFAHSPVT